MTNKPPVLLGENEEPHITVIAESGFCNLIRDTHHLPGGKVGNPNVKIVNESALYHLTKLYPHEKQTLAISEGKRGNPNTTVISESGLYKLILKSRKPEAEEFQRWVTEQVLPTIRKTGVYMTPEVAALAVEDPAVFLARALVIGFTCGFVSSHQGPPQPLQASERKLGWVAAGASVR